MTAKFSVSHNVSSSANNAVIFNFVINLTHKISMRNINTTINHSNFQKPSPTCRPS